MTAQNEECVHSWCDGAAHQLVVGIKPSRSCWKQMCAHPLPAPAPLRSFAPLCAALTAATSRS